MKTNSSVIEQYGQKSLSMKTNSSGIEQYGQRS